MLMVKASGSGNGAIPDGLYNSPSYWYCGLPGTNGGTDPNVPGYVPPSADFGPSPRGSHGTTPWTYSLNLNLSYTPRWLDGLTLRADVINVLTHKSVILQTKRVGL